MKRLLNILNICMASLFLFASCNDHGDLLLGNYGYVEFNLAKASEDISVTTKDTDPTFSVTITNSQGVVVKAVNDHRDLVTDPLKLQAGTYTVTATTGDVVEAGFDKPYYSGTSSFVVKAGETTTSTVICSLANNLIDIVLDNSVETNFKQYYVTVTNGNENGSLIFSKDNNTLDKSGYLRCTGTIKWSMYLVNNNNNVYDGVVNGTITDVQPKQHYTLKFTTSDSEEGGAMNISIICDNTLNEHTHDVTIPLTKKAKPIFTTNGFDLTSQQYIAEGTNSTWQVNINAQAGIKTLILAHSSITLSNMGIPYSFDIVNADASTKSAVNAAGLTWGDVAEGSTQISLNFSNLIKTLVQGDYSIGITALDRQAQQVASTFKFSIIPSVETTTIGAEPWAKHAILSAKWNTISQPAGVGFEYKKVSDTQWTKVTSGLQISGSNYTVQINNLDPSTKYSYRAISDKEASNELQFTTEAALQISNMTFDSWTSESKSTALGSRTFDSPNASLSDKWWDSSNGGACIASVYPVTKETSHVIKGNAAKVSSKSALGVLAAGSVYLGEFGATVGTSGAYLDFGRSYTCRPLSLHGYYDYSPVNIDKTKDPYIGMSGKTDVGQIYVILTDWDKPFTVNTSTGTFVDIVNDTHIIAYGELSFNESTNGVYKEFNISLSYRNKRTPKYCVIVASSSKYGDYFTGGIGSTLYVDEFEFKF